MKFSFLVSLLFASCYAELSMKDFEIGKVIESGTFATIKYATSVSSRELMAIKIPYFFTKMQRIINERDILKLLPENSNVVKFFDTARSFKFFKPSLVFEYLYQGLGSILENPEQKLNIDMKRNLFRGMVNAVKHLHENDICHREIRPANFMLSRPLFPSETIEISSSPLEEQDPVVKLVNFEMAKKDDGTLEKNIGNDYYKSPELISDLKSSGCKEADVWALGVSLVVLIDNSMPFTGSDRRDLHHSISTLEPLVIANSDLLASSPLNELMKGMLKKDPAGRLTIEQVAEHSWLVNAE